MIVLSVYLEGYHFKEKGCLCYIIRDVRQGGEQTCTGDLEGGLC